MTSRSRFDRYDIPHLPDEILAPHRYAPGVTHDEDGARLCGCGHAHEFDVCDDCSCSLPWYPAVGNDGRGCMPRSSRESELGSSRESELERKLRDIVRLSSVNVPRRHRLYATEGGQATTKQLAADTGASQAAVLRIMHKLEAEGLVSHGENETGRSRGSYGGDRQPKAYHWFLYQMDPDWGPDDGAE